MHYRNGLNLGLPGTKYKFEHPSGINASGFLGNDIAIIGPLLRFPFFTLMPIENHLAKLMH